MNSLEQAKKFSREKHQGQVDKANEDYYLAHIEVVANKVKNAGYSKAYILSAYLHDVVEDTDATINDIENLFDSTIASAISALSKIKGESYSKYIERVQENKIAVVVKYYDMEHNSDLSRLVKIKEKDLKRRDKYIDYMSKLEFFL